MNEELPQRKQPAHHAAAVVFNRAVIIHVTICTDKRKPIMATEDVHQLLRSAWQAADHWRVGRYMILPDHIHLFCAPAIHDYPPLVRWVHFWKSWASQRWPRQAEQPVWQKSFWDTQLRRSEDYAAKWEYVRHNCVRHGYVATPEAWPYQGEMNELRWHD